MPFFKMFHFIFVLTRSLYVDSAVAYTVLLSLLVPPLLPGCRPASAHAGGLVFSAFSLGFRGSS